MVTLASIPVNLRRAPPSWQKAAENLLGRKVHVLQVDNLGWTDGREVKGQAFVWNGKRLALVRMISGPWTIAETFVHEVLHHKHPIARIRRKSSGGWKVTYYPKQDKARIESAVDTTAKRIMREIRRLWDEIPHDRPEWLYNFNTPSSWRGLITLEEIMEIIAEADL